MVTKNRNFNKPYQENVPIGPNQTHFYFDEIAAAGSESITMSSVIAGPSLQT